MNNEFYGAAKVFFNDSWLFLVFVHIKGINRSYGHTGRKHFYFLRTMYKMNKGIFFIYDAYVLLAAK